MGSVSTSTTRTASTRRRPSLTGPAGPLPSSIAPLSTATARTLTVRERTTEKTTEKVCETVHQRYPDVSERQHCHNEDKKVCQLEERTQPKQVKKYVYTKQCRKVPRKVCENADNKSLVPSCVPSVRKECTYHPAESCDEVPKKHCYKVGKQVKKEKCEEYKEEYPAPAPEY